MHKKAQKSQLQYVKIGKTSISGKFEDKVLNTTMKYYHVTSCSKFIYK